MKPRRGRWLRLAALSMTCLCLLAAPAWAKEEGERQPPYDVPGIEHHKIWVPWIFAFLFAGACIAIAFKNPHRTHLD